MKISVEILNINNTSEQDKAVVEINADEEGLDYLIKLLSDLKKNGDHFHLMTPAWGMDDLSEEQYHEKSVLVNHLEIIRNEGVGKTKKEVVQDKAKRHSGPPSV